jgi:hypothetical protein
MAKLAVLHMLLPVVKLEERMTLLSSSNVVILSGIVNPRSHACVAVRYVMEPYTSPFLGFNLYVFELVFITARQQPDFMAAMSFQVWSLGSVVVVVIKFIVHIEPFFRL